MTDRPILFSGPMVRALLAGTKTQTRRILKPQPSAYTGNPIPPEGLSWTSKKRDEPYFAMHDDQVHWCWWDEYNRQGPDWIKLRIAKGDRLYVRESGWQRPDRTPEMMRQGADTWEPYYFDADGLSEQDRDDLREWGFKRRPGIHMPRRCSRLTLTVTDVRVERLQDISEVDAWAEGIDAIMKRGFPTRHDVTLDLPGSPRWFQPRGVDVYQSLWETINGPGSWESNPWIYAVSFTVQRGNIDAQV
ncbi:hypothetical protein [Devosia naphthalenivorans]|uniref:hypothetical protein n=1 Tax=Devosia naphthalenivorans TaxID=2082392 RepID=UPI000D3CA492|nr:hypothetical protein [Devosia naphthalenivorans]